VLRVRVTGDYLRPEKVVDALRPQYEFGESELLVGDLDNIAEVLAREHAVRFPHGKSAGTIRSS
jgi:hypothetical protein